jgi:hypothetical protein
MGRTPITLDATVPPGWVIDLLDGATLGEALPWGEGATTRLATSGHYSLVECRVPGAGKNSEKLETMAEAAYLQFQKVLESVGACTPIRFWNFVPDILRPEGTGAFYEAFNRGRFRAFVSWFGKSRFSERITAATGVGHRGQDLVLLALAAESTGEMIENPMQTPAYEYSDDYGVLPPCFARATRIRTRPHPGEDLLIVSGTAAVVGELSMHPENVELQSLETFANMARLLNPDDGEESGDCKTVEDSLGDPRDPASLAARLAAYRELRVYVVREHESARVLELVHEYFPSATRVELSPADLCREDLLVEIEGIATL